MGLINTKANHKQSQKQDTSSDILKNHQKNELEFRQNDFIRQIEGSIFNQYDILSPYFFSNQFYELRKAIHLKTKLIRSVYIINKYKVRSTQRQLLQDQINRLKSIDHPNINKIYQLFKDNHRFYIVMQLCYGQSLAEMLERQQLIEERRAAQIMHQILNVLGHCHRKGIIHTDLKLENIRFNSQKQDIVKIVDFSISKIFRIDDIIQQSLGKTFLCSPQSLANDISSKSDIWQCGMILYILLSGLSPITGLKKGKLSRKLIYFVPRFDDPKFQKISKQAKELLCSMLKLNPNERPSAEMCLESSWFKKYYKEPEISLSNLRRCLLECYHFNPSSKLQQATWTFFVNVLVPFSQKQNILYVFKKLDRTNKGELGFDELYDGFRQIYNDNEKCRFLASFLLNRLQKQKLTFSHFITISTNRLFMITDSNIKKIFQIFDQDQSGQISVNELKQILGSSKQVNEQIWVDLMKEADANSDGMISFTQFSEMMKSLLKKQNEYLYEMIKANNNVDNESDNLSEFVI